MSSSSSHPSVENVGAAVATPSAPPNGGVLAWSQCMAAFILFFNSWGIVNAFGAFEAFYASSLLRSESASTISWIGSLQAFLFIFGGIVTGSTFDRGYSRPLILFGSCAIVFGLMMLSLCRTYWQVLLAQGVAVGIGNACLFVPSSAIIPQYFSTHRALAMGISISGGNVGGIVYSVLVSRSIPAIGFPWTVRVMGFMALATFLPSLVILRQRVTPSTARNIIDPSALRDPAFVLYAATCGTAFVGFYIIWFFADSFGRETKVVSSSLAPYLVTLLNTGSFFGRLLLCALADHLGAMNMLTVCLVAQTALSFGWVGVVNEPGAIVLFLLYGAFSGAFISLLLTTVAVALCPDISKLGTRTGMVTVVCSIGFLVGSPIGGKLLHYGWTGPQAFSGAMLGLSTVLAIAVRTLLSRRSVADSKESS